MVTPDKPQIRNVLAAAARKAAEQWPFQPIRLAIS
jgi:hypothetical protein